LAEIPEDCVRAFGGPYAKEVKLTWEVGEASSYVEEAIQPAAKNVPDYATSVGCHAKEAWDRESTLQMADLFFHIETK
jgi:hypothetical protein